MSAGRRRGVLRGAVGTVAVTGVAHTSPSPTATAPATVPSSSSPSASTSASTSAPTSDPTSAPPSPTASVPDAGSDGQGPVTPVQCVATKSRSIGAGTTAVLSISPSGPLVRFRGAAAGVDTAPPLRLGLNPDGTIEVPSVAQADRSAGTRTA